ncbi:hypothetical protein PQR39_35180 [Paraburkholderia sediminicola]|uniref:hypothetical protein n=1 Tax=Paraburkholderia sediminicola TaxID=458836 RepID=UPI0038B6B7E5
MHFFAFDSFHKADSWCIIPLTQKRGENEMSNGQAKQGGEVGVNGYLYKGGQFLPSTQAEPGKWKVGKKWITTGREIVSPGKFEVQPTPFSRSLFVIAGVGHFTRIVGGKLVINEGVRCNDGITPVTLDMQVRPGVRGVLGKEALTLGEIIAAWNDGQRWFDVQPNAITVTA